METCLYIYIVNRSALHQCKAMTCWPQTESIDIYILHIVLNCTFWDFHSLPVRKLRITCILWIDDESDIYKLTYNIVDFARRGTQWNEQWMRKWYEKCLQRRPYIQESFQADFCFGMPPDLKDVIGEIGNWRRAPYSHINVGTCEVTNEVVNRTDKKMLSV